jgi:protein-S-isoprenylcysteine O-methyltransferase Ste14
MDSSKRDESLNHTPGIIRWVITSFIFLLLVAASLFLSAGTINWQMAWFYLLLTSGILVIDALVLIRISPELLGERSRYQKGAKKWDQLLSRLMATIGPLIIWIVSGLDFRNSWSPQYPIWLVILSSGMIFAGSMLTLWAMASNRFFIGMVRIQDERGHTVINTGPYRLVRHPGYLGSLLYLLFTPIMLASFWGFIPAVLTCGVVFLRTYLEDITLLDELPGYEAYSAEIRYHLVPGIW